MPKKIDLSNKKFGRLTVIEDTGKRSKGKKIIYLCQCDCGCIIETLGNSLMNGDTKSCGCLKKEKVKTHGLSKTKIYRIWADMIQRCTNEKSNNYKKYGAKSVSVCEDWMDFQNFYDWSIRNGYQDGLSIDRENPCGDYKPDNCRWVTREVQDNNKRTSIFAEIRGELLTLAQISKKYSVNYGMVKYRYHLGERGEKLIEPPKRGVKRNGKQNKPKFMKLNAQIVGEIKWLSRNTSMIQKEIAGLYKVTQTTVWAIKNGKLHGDVSEIKPGWYDEND